MTDVSPPRGPDLPSLFILGSQGSLAKTKLLPAAHSSTTGPLGQVDRAPAQAQISPAQVANGLNDAPRNIRAIFRWLQKQIPEKGTNTRVHLTNRMISGEEGRREVTEILSVSKNPDQKDQYVFTSESPLISDNLTSDNAYEMILKRMRDQKTAVAHFYCAVPPSLYGTIIKKLVAHRFLSRSDVHGEALPRFILEKPFGTNQAAAEQLSSYWTEQIKKENLDDQQMVLVDHYLYKPLIEQWIDFGSRAHDEGMWTRSCINQIQISVIENEKFGKEKATYEELGALGDMIQNHLLKLLCITVANRPRVIRGRGKIEQIDWNIQDLEGKNILESVKNIDKNSVMLGQYEGAELSRNCETYVAVRIDIQSDDWRGVPCFLRTGKALNRKSASIKIIFNDESVLTYRLQPDPQIALVVGG